MKFEHILLIMGVVGAGVVGLLYYKKEWPFNQQNIPKKDDDEEETIVKDIQKEIPIPKKTATLIPTKPTLDSMIENALIPSSKNKSPWEGAVDWFKGLGCGVIRPC